MLYINLSDSSIEVIETKKRISGGEAVIAVSRKDIDEGIVSGGKIEQQDKLLMQLRDIFVSAYPKQMRDKSVSVLISDKQAITFRSVFTKEYKENELTKKIIEEATKILPGDADNFEHFYKEIVSSKEEREILYSRMSKATILSYAQAFESAGLKLCFLSPKPFAIFELLKSLDLEQKKILYCDASKKDVEYMAFDKYGLVLSLEPKMKSKTFATQVKTVIKELSERKINISNVILAGAGSIEIHAKEASEKLELPVVKLGEIIDDILRASKINFDTGGVARMLFASPAGLVMLVRGRSAPNFARDLKLIRKPVSFKGEEKISEVVDEKTSAVKTLDKVDESILDQYRETAMITDEIVESRKKNFLQIFTNKFVVIIISAILVFGLVMAASSFLGKGSAGLPFLKAPTVTPTLTPPPPTATPTPTIDPSLKRADLKVSVQNGTDKTGYARATADYLQEKKYQDIAISNADKDTYEKSIINIKEEKKNYLPLVVEDLKDKIDTSTVASLSAEAKYDVVIILGQK